MNKNAINKLQCREHIISSTQLKMKKIVYYKIILKLNTWHKM
jgi:hypothetical protein